MEAAIDWNSPPSSEHNGVIIAYSVSLIDSITGDEAIFIYNSTSIILKDLQPYTAYQCAVAAYTAVGLGPMSSYYLFRTAEDGEFK